jgi:hypothetical protein
MQMTDIQPVPVEVFPGTGKMLFTPVYHIKVRGVAVDGWRLVVGGMLLRLLAQLCSHTVQSLLNTKPEPL